VIDFIIGAGGANPQPGWGEVWNPQEIPTRATWVKPPIVAGGTPNQPPRPEPPPPPRPVKKQYPGDRFFDSFGNLLELDYHRYGQTLNGQSATWFARVIWDHINEGLSMEESVTKHRAEWLAALRGE
jgi:hypothetical protein